jgi:hypothetical protein
LFEFLFHLLLPSHLNRFDLHHPLNQQHVTLKVVLDFFLSGEVIGSRLNMSCDVGDYVRVGRSNVVVDCVGVLSFKNYSLVIGLNETCCS